MIGYSLVEVTGLYPKYLSYFYQKHPGALSKPYREHIRDIFNDCNAECDFLHTELHKLGVQSALFLYNAEQLQRSWDPAFQSASLFDIFLAQLKKADPDVLLISDLFLFDKNQLDTIRETLHSNAKIVGWHFTVITDDFLKISGYYDQIYTGSLYFCDLLKNHCKDVQLLRHAFSPSILEKIHVSSVENSAVFPGSIMIGNDMHTNRIDMLSQLIKQNAPFCFYGTVYGSFSARSIKGKIKQLLRSDTLLKERKKAEKEIREKAYPDVFGLDYYQVLANHTVCINNHAPIAGSGTGNMRVYEATGIGTCLLTDERAENSRIFDTSTEIVTYTDYADCAAKAKWLLDHPQKTREIAEAGHKRTLKEHTYETKAKILNSYLCDLLKR